MCVATRVWVGVCGDRVVAVAGVGDQFYLLVDETGGPLVPGALSLPMTLSVPISQYRPTGYTCSSHQRRPVCSMVRIHNTPEEEIDGGMTTSGVDVVKGSVADRG